MYVTYDKEIDYNYITSDNNAKVVSFSSQCKGCAASNIICNDKKSIWLTDSITPQYVTIDLGNLMKKPKKGFKYFGIYCWHAYSTNPKRVEIFFSKDNKNFVSFGIYEIALKPGNQFFEIKNNKLLENKQYRYLKIVIKLAYGGNRTYVNQIYLFEDLAGMNNNTSTINTNKISTQYSENKRNVAKSESESVYLNEKSKNNSIVEEEEESVRQIDVERSKLNSRLSEDLKDYSRQRMDFIDKSLENKRIIFEEKIRKRNSKNKFSESNREDYKYKEIHDRIYESPVRDDRLKDKIKNKITKSRRDDKTLDNIAPRYDKEVRNYDGFIQKEDDLDSEKEEQKKKIYFKNASPEKNKYFIQNFRKNSNSDTKTKLYSKDYHKNQEYRILETQLKEMEDHLDSMKADMQLQSFKSDKYNHSRSFSYLNPSQEMKYNPFLDFNFRSLNKTSDILSTYNQNNKRMIRNENIISNYINEDDMPEDKHKAENDRNLDNKSQIDKKIENIESKITNFEKEMSDLKQNFQMLISNINRLVESNEKLYQFNNLHNIPSHNNSNQFQNLHNFPQNNSHFNNPSNLNSFINNQINKMNLNNSGEEQMNQNEMMSIILNECQNLINEKININQLNQTHNSNKFLRNLNKSRKSSLGKLEFRGNEDREENNLIFEKRLGYKIDEKFESLANNIESQIYKNFLKPSLEKIDRTMKSNLEEIKNKIKTLAYDDTESNVSNSKRYSLNSLSQFEDDSSKLKNVKIKDEKEKRFDNKFEDINSLGGRLYEKLLEKERKLNKLKNDTTKYLKNKLNTTNSDGK